MDKERRERQGRRRERTIINLCVLFVQVETETETERDGETAATAVGGVKLKSRRIHTHASYRQSILINRITLRLLGQSGGGGEREGGVHRWRHIELGENQREEWGEREREGGGGGEDWEV